MDEPTLRVLIDQVERGLLSRRRFVQLVTGLGCSAAMISGMLGSAGT